VNDQGDATFSCRIKLWEFAPVFGVDPPLQVGDEQGQSPFFAFISFGSIWALKPLPHIIIGDVDPQNCNRQFQNYDD
jgi:hypothetical protein